jgi:hypothetical protein
MFATFNVALPLSDFITDILTSQAFFQRGHFYWGLCTLSFVFLPFVGRLAIGVTRIFNCFLSKSSPGDKQYPTKMIHFKVLCGEVPELIWHFPPLNIVRSVFQINI